MKINNKNILTPSKLVVVISDIDGESFRNAQGLTIRDRLATKRKLECEQNALTGVQMKDLQQAVKDAFFTVTYEDPYTNSTQTKTFYVGDRTASVYSYNQKFQEMRYESLKMNLIER